MTFQVPITTPARKLAQADVTTDLQRREYLMRALSTSLSSSTNYIFAPLNTPPMKRHPPIKPLFLPTPTLGCLCVCVSELYIHMYICIYVHVCGGTPVHLLGGRPEENLGCLTTHSPYSLEKKTLTEPRATMTASNPNTSVSTLLRAGGLFYQC